MKLGIMEFPESLNANLRSKFQKLKIAVVIYD